MKPGVFAAGLLALVSCTVATEQREVVTTSSDDVIATTSPPTTTSRSTTTSAPATTTTTIPRISIVGKIVDGDGRSVAGADVVLGEISTTTDEYGFFGMEATAGGRLVASRPGWTSGEYVWGKESRFARITIEPRTIRGIHVSAEAAGDDSRFEGLLHLAEATSVNAFVFDTKQEGGKVLYDTTVGEAHDIEAVDVWYDPEERISQAHDAGLYAITRIVVFEDAFRARAHPEEKLAGPWVDPGAAGAHGYNLALAAEACQLGFDEVQFDYVRFPSGKTAAVSGQLSLSQEERVATIEGFLKAAADLLGPMGCAVSADVFAIIVSTPDDQGLGQRPEELSRWLDFLSPMIYPSHYSLGWLGLADPNDHPYAVTAAAIDDALGRIDDDAVLRPWLQAFWWSSDQIRSSIQAAEDRGVGWMLWNVNSNFDGSSIPTEEEVGS